MDELEKMWWQMESRNGQHIKQRKMGQWMNMVKLNNGWMQGNRAMDEFQEIENDEVLESWFLKTKQWMNLNLNNAKTLKTNFLFRIKKVD